MSEFKGIPIVPPAALARSGEKYTTPQGFTAIKDGIKHSHGGRRATPRKPAWLRAPLATGAEFGAVKQIVREHRLSTVCEEAKCPNIGECWNAGTATIMLMGAVCTRACRFCAVDTGNPRGWLDAEEPENVAKSVAADGPQIRGAHFGESRRPARTAARRTTRRRFAPSSAAIRTPPSRR